MKRVLPASLAVLSLAAACGGGRIPAVGPDRTSGQSGLMDKTFAGANKCNPKNHDRPFVVEWDATDMSQFEALTKKNVVFVKYEGCELKVIDSCKNDSIDGLLGSYKSVDWTSGSVEKIDITNEGELYAKLPLGVATLGARVSAGEAFRMEYFVSGTQSATRPAEYKADISKMPGCKGATHFVYAFNLGAFALGSNKNVKAEANATFWGAGAGGSSKSASAAEKKGGLLASCRGESAKEIETCKTPIRLTLREIEDGDNPDAKAAVAPETPDALNLAGKLDATKKLEGKAKELMASAEEKQNSRDGKGCLGNLDAYDALAASSEQSTSPKSYFSARRAQCLMLSGQCDAGKLLFRKYMEAHNPSQLGAEQIDNQVTYVAGQNCQGSSMSPRDQIVKAKADLQRAQSGKVDLAVCRGAYDTIRRLRKTVKVEASDPANTTPDSYGYSALQCFAKAKDCQSAWNVTRELDMERAEDRGHPYSTSSTVSQLISAGCHVNDVSRVTPVEKVIFATTDLDKLNDAKVDAAACREAYGSGKGAASSLKGEKDRETLGHVSSLHRQATECFVKAGDCNAAWTANKDGNSGEDTVHSLVGRWGSATARKCPVKELSGLSAPEKVAVAAQELQNPSEKKSVAECKASLDVGKSAAASLTASPESDGLIQLLQAHGAACLARADDCAASRKAFMDLGRMSSSNARQKDPEASLARSFESRVRECKGK